MFNYIIIITIIRQNGINTYKNAQCHINRQIVLRLQVIFLINILRLPIKKKKTPELRTTNLNFSLNCKFS